MIYADRIKQQSTSVGTGNMVLSSTPAGYRQFATVYSASDRFLYVIQEPVSGQWEIGWGYLAVNQLVRETPLVGSSATPVSFGPGTKDAFVAHNAGLSSAMKMALFGGGITGDLAVTGAVTLNQDAHFKNLTVSGVGALRAAGNRVLVSETLNLANAGQSAIYNSGIVSVGVAGGQGGIAGSCGGGTSGGNGAAGGTGVGAQGAASSALVNSNGGRGGTSGAGGAGTSGAGGASRAAGTVSHTQLPSLFDPLSNDGAGTGVQLIGGGTGGGGGASGAGDGANNGGSGTGGAGGGGVLDLRAWILIVGPSTAAACIDVRGGAADIGGTPGAGNCGGGAGGGGGGGGYARVIVGHLIGTAAGAISASGGRGGNGGGKTGTGVVGDGGDGGSGGIIDVWNLSLGTMTRLIGSAGSAHSGQTGGGGGACNVDL